MYNIGLEKVFNKMVKEFGLYVLTTERNKMAIYPGLTDPVMILYDDCSEIWLIEDLFIFMNKISRTLWFDRKRCSQQYVRNQISCIIEKYKKLTNELRIKELEKDFRND